MKWIEKIFKIKKNHDVFLSNTEINIIKKKIIKINKLLNNKLPSEKIRLKISITEQKYIYFALYDNTGSYGNYPHIEYIHKSLDNMIKNNKSKKK